MTAELGPESEELLKAYRAAFASPAGQAVLVDLMKVCRFRVEIENMVDEGKRRVFLRIMNFLALTPEQIADLYRGQRIPTATGASDDEYQDELA